MVKLETSYDPYEGKFEYHLSNSRQGTTQRLTFNRRDIEDLYTELEEFFAREKRAKAWEESYNEEILNDYQLFDERD